MKLKWWEDSLFNGKKRHKEAYLLHERFKNSTPIVLNAHVARVASLIVVNHPQVTHELSKYADPKLKRLTCIVISGDSMGNMSIFYFSMKDITSHNVKNQNRRSYFKPQVQFRGAHQGCINCLKHIPGSDRIVSAGDDGAVCVWSIRQDQVQQNKIHLDQKLLFHSSCVLTCDVEQSGQLIVSGGMDGVVALWLLGVPIPVLTITVGKSVISVKLLPEDPSLLVIADEDSISIWDIKAQPHYSYFRGLLFQKMTKNKDLLYQKQIKKLLQTFKEDHHYTVTAPSVLSSTSAESRIVHFEAVSKEINGSASHKSVYNENLRRYIRPFCPHPYGSSIRQVLTLFGGTMLLSSTTGSSHKLWDLTTSSKGCATLQSNSKMYISPSDPSSSFSFHKTHLLCAPVTCCSQENFLYGTDETGKILVWKIERLREKKSIECAFIYPLYKIEGHHFLVTSIGLSMDDTILVTGDVSGKIHFRSVFNS